MTLTTAAASPKTYARTAGALYLVIAALSAFCIAYVPSNIFVAGDTAATAANLLTKQDLVRMGIAADVLLMLVEIAFAAMLFVLFRATSPTLAIVAMVSRLMMVTVMAINLLINILPMVLLGGAGYLGVFSPEQQQASAMVLIEAHQLGVYVWDMFFGFHLLVLGYLIIRSADFPRLLGVAMIVGSAGYVLEGLTHVTFSDGAATTLPIVALIVVASLSELVFAFWLLFGGVKVTAWSKFRTAPVAG